jgi:hypothetical protein
MDTINTNALSAKAPNKADTAMLGRHEDHDGDGIIGDTVRHWVLHRSQFDVDNLGLNP